MEKSKQLYFTVILVLFVLFSCDNGISSIDLNNNLEVYETGSRSIINDIRSIATRAIVNYFSIGTLRNSVIDTLGIPDTIFYGPTTYMPPEDYLDEDAYFVYNSIGLSFRIFGNSVKEITLLNDDWMASNGLIVGMTRSNMLSVLGNSYSKQDFAIKSIYEYDQYAISIEVGNADNLIWEINIQEGNAK